ncbi:MAG: contractile injection system protein, VgrG/Pvc8 family [Candidatus Dechloromonas phosphoritropha]|jgi:phage protein D
MTAPALPLVGITRFTLTIGGVTLAPAVKADISSLELCEDLNMPAMLTFSLNLWDSMRLRLKEDYLDQFALGTPIELTLGINSESAVFSGEVTALEPVFGGLDGHDSLKVQAYNRLHRLTFGDHQRTFKDRTSSDIASEIASNLGLTASVDSTNDKHPHLTQINETDLAFLLRLARPLNYEVSVEDKTLSFCKPKPQAGAVVSLTYRRDLVEFTPRQRAMPEGTKVEVRGWDVKTKKPIVGKAGPGDETAKMGSGQTGAERSAAAFSATSTTHTISAPALINADQATQIAKAWYDRQQNTFIKAEGECAGSPLIRAGKTIDIAGVGKVFSATYYVESAKHTIGPTGYRTRFEVTRNTL